MGGIVLRSGSNSAKRDGSQARAGPGTRAWMVAPAGLSRGHQGGVEVWAWATNGGGGQLGGGG
jgi:hypothetical protein